MWMWHSSLDCRDPGSTRYTGEPEAKKVGDRKIWCSYGIFLASGSSAPVGIKCGGGTVALIMGTLAMPVMEDHHYPFLQEIQCY